MAKNKRTKNGQGTIRQLANGKYQCSIETKDALGKRVIRKQNKNFYINRYLDDTIAFASCI